MDGHEALEQKHYIKVRELDIGAPAGPVRCALIPCSLQAAGYSYQMPDGTRVTLGCEPTQSVITLTGQPNSRYLISASEDLVQWITLASEANLGASGTFLYADARRLPKCFYRVSPYGRVLQINQFSGGGSRKDIKLGQKGAQSFRNGGPGGPNYFITKVVLHLSREAELPNANLNINIGVAVNSGAIPGSSMSIAPAQITDTSAGITFMTLQINYPTPVGPLISGTTYYLNLECEASNLKEIYIEYARSNAYPGGTYYEGGLDDAKDVWFELWGNNATP